MRGRSDYVDTWRGGTRLEAGRGVGVVATNDDGVVRMLFEASDRTPFEINAFGFSLPELLDVADQMRGHDGALDIDYGALPDTVLAGTALRLEMAVATGGLDAFGLLSQPDAGAWYQGPVLQGIEIRVAQRVVVDDAVYDFLLQDIGELEPAEEEQLAALDRSHIDFRLRGSSRPPGQPASRRGSRTAAR